MKVSEEVFRAGIRHVELFLGNPFRLIWTETVHGGVAERVNRLELPLSLEMMRLAHTPR